MQNPRCRPTLSGGVPEASGTTRPPHFGSGSSEQLSNVNCGKVCSRCSADSLLHAMLGRPVQKPRNADSVFSASTNVTLRPGDGYIVEFVNTSNPAQIFANSSAFSVKPPGCKASQFVITLSETYDAR